MHGRERCSRRGGARKEAGKRGGVARAAPPVCAAGAGACVAAGTDVRTEGLFGCPGASAAVKIS